MKKPAFISGIGRHSIKSLGKDLAFDQFLKIHNQIKNEGLSASHFKDLSKNMSYGDILMSNGLKIGTALLLKTLESNDLNSVHDSKKLFFTQLNNNRFARSKIFNKVTVHYGSETSKRITNYRNTPNIETQNKMIFDTEVNLNNSSRKDLNLKSGFNQKNYSFIPSRFGLTRGKFYSLHKQSIEKVKKSKTNLKQIFSCSYFVKNELKIFNNDQDFNANVEIFLFHIKNRLSPYELLNASFHTEAKEISKNKIAGTNGFFPKDQQINVLPTLSDNKCLKNIINLKTTLSSDVFKDSEFLKNNLKLVNKWKRTLTPGSLFQLNMTQHLGKGINLNKFIIEEEKNKSIENFLPISRSCLLDNSLLVILNYGERNCRLIDKKYQSPRNGYSTSNINFEFKTTYKYLGEGEFFEQPCTYREKRKSELFESKLSINEEELNKDFNINYEDIGTLEEQNFYLERSEKLENMTTNDLDKLKELYQSAKIEDVDSLSEDDFIFSKNLTNSTDEIDDDLEDIDLFEE